MVLVVARRSTLYCLPVGLAGPDHVQGGARGIREETSGVHRQFEQHEEEARQVLRGLSEAGWTVRDEDVGCERGHDKRRRSL